jgi:hypothetical protein
MCATIFPPTRKGVSLPIIQLAYIVRWIISQPFSFKLEPVRMRTDFLGFS